MLNFIRKIKMHLYVRTRAKYKIKYMKIQKSKLFRSCPR